MSNHITNFIAEMEKHGVFLKDTSEVIPSEKDRLIKNADGKKCIYYNFSEVGDTSYGHFYDCSTGISGFWFSKQKSKWSDEEKEAWKKRRTEIIDADIKEQADKHKAARREVAKIYKLATTATEHPYITKKRIQPETILVDDDGRLVVMMVDVVDGTLWNVQTIAEDGFKMYHPRARKNGLCCPIGWKPSEQHPETIVFCEGYATGQSIFEATGLPVAVAFDTSNLSHVTKAFKAKNPDAKIIFAADNDHWTFKTPRHNDVMTIDRKDIAGDDPKWSEWRGKGYCFNSGVEAANKAAITVAGFVAIPPFEPDDPNKNTDFNDLASRDGNEAVSKIFEAVVQEINRPIELTTQQKSDLLVNPYEILKATGYLVNDNGFKLPFRVLGNGNGMYYFYSFYENQVVALSPSQITKNHLLRLASEPDWEEYVDQRKTKIFEIAPQIVIKAAQDRGYYNPAGKIRGGGIWIDADRIVVNYGDKLLVDGEWCELEDLPSSFIYVASEKIKKTKESLTAEEGAAFREVCEMASWKNKLSGSILAGWIVGALACSSVDWRTHIWIVGPRNSGKSTLVRDLIRVAISANVLNVDQGTTEAAIRSHLRHDGKPIVYDESEQDGRNLRSIMTGVLQLARGCSDGKTVGKFGQDLTHPVSAFCFACVNPLIESAATASRIMMLNLEENKSLTAHADFINWQAKMAKVINEDFSYKLFKRVADNAATFRKNVSTFKAASRAVINSGRSADQMGFVLAGLYLLQSDKEITADEAEKWVSAQKWDNYIDAGEDSESVAMVKYLGNSVISIVTNTYRKNITMGELVLCAAGVYTKVDFETATEYLKQYGMRYKSGRLYIANVNQNLAKLFKDKPHWVTHDKGWANILEYYPDAQKHDSMTFGKGTTKQRAISIPANIFFCDDNNIEFMPENDNISDDDEVENEEVTWTL